MSWCYGLVKDKGMVILVEVYMDKDDKPWGMGPPHIDGKQTKKDIIRDITDQLTNFRIWKKSDFTGKKP